VAIYTTLRLANLEETLPRELLLINWMVNGAAPNAEPTSTGL